MHENGDSASAEIDVPSSRSFLPELSAFHCLDLFVSFGSPLAALPFWDAPGAPRAQAA